MDIKYLISLTEPFIFLLSINNKSHVFQLKNIYYLNLFVLFYQITTFNKNIKIYKNSFSYLNKL